MSNEVVDLTGLTILVVEDDYYQAADAKEAFEAAGAIVTGPFSTAPEAIRAVERVSPDCAVIDINLGDGPTFEFARELKKRGVPIVLVSGYRSTILPADLKDLVHLEKPTEVPSLIKAVRAIAARPR